MLIGVMGGLVTLLVVIGMILMTPRNTKTAERPRTGSTSRRVSSSPDPTTGADPPHASPSPNPKAA